MSKYRSMLGVAVASAAALLGLLVVAGAQANSSCNPAHSRTLASSNLARVYGKGGKAYVCWRSNGDTTRLTGASSKCQHGPQVYVCDRFALSGKWVAWTRNNPSDVDISGARVSVMYVPTRSVDSRWYPTDQRAQIYKIVLLRDGAVAWTESVSDGGGGAFAVGVYGTDLKNHPIDRLDGCGGDPSTQATCYIDAGSLRVTRASTISWTYRQDPNQPPSLTATHALY